MANINWRTINVDLLDPESPSNFPTASLTPSVPPVSIAEVQGLAAQVKQLLRGGDAEGALRGALENPPYGGDAAAKVRSTPSSVIAERPRYSGETTVSSVKSDYSADVRPKEVHLSTVVETLQSIKQSDMSPMLHKIYDSDDGPETLDVLMKYLYKGMSHNAQPAPTSTRSLSSQPTGFSQIHSRGGGEGGGQAMSVLLSWHEKLVEIAGKGSIVRVMTDRRTV